MKINKDGKIEIDIQDILTPEVLHECAKHTVFEKDTIDGFVQLMITDEVDWNDGGPSWYVTSSFGKSYFEQARIQLIKNIDKISSKQIEMLVHEREVFEKYYHEYQKKAIDIADRALWLDQQVTHLRETNSDLGQKIIDLENENKKLVSVIKTLEHEVEQNVDK